MNAFKINDSNKKAIMIKYLDKEACIFWGVESDPKWYASPKTDYETINWYDSIGYYIAHPSSGWTSGWDNVKCSLFVIQASGLCLKSMEDQIKSLRFINEYLKPYFDLIDHWKEKGYDPIQIEQ